MKPSTTTLVLVVVILCSGCAQLASPVDDRTTTAPEPTAQTPTPTATSTETAVTRPTTERRTPTATATPIATATTTTTPTATPTLTPARPPTATTTPIRTVTTKSTTRAPEPANLTIGRVDASNETVEFHNTGGRSLDLKGYVVDFDDGQRYTFPRYVLAAGETLTLHTGRGDGAGAELYAGFFYPVINDNRETVLVENPDGNIVLVVRVPSPQNASSRVALQ